MTRHAPVVATLEEPGAPDPPGLDGLRSLGATVHVVRTVAALATAVTDADADVVVVHGFRSDLLHQLDRRLGTVTWVHAASAGLDAVLTPEVVARRVGAVAGASS